MVDHWRRTSEVAARIHGGPLGRCLTEADILWQMAKAPCWFQRHQHGCFGTLFGRWCCTYFFHCLMYICVTISRSATISGIIFWCVWFWAKNRSRFLPQGFVHLAKLISATASTGYHRCSLLGFEEKRFFVQGNWSEASVKYMWDLYYPLSGFPY